MRPDGRAELPTFYSGTRRVCRAQSDSGADVAGGGGTDRHAIESGHHVVLGLVRAARAGVHRPWAGLSGARRNMPAPPPSVCRAKSPSCSGFLPAVKFRCRVSSFMPRASPHYTPEHRSFRTPRQVATIRMVKLRHGLVTDPDDSETRLARTSVHRVA
jgi:hypothetical protein